MELDPDTEAYFREVKKYRDLMINEETAVNNFVVGAKQNGMWDKMDVIFLPAPLRPDGNPINLKQPLIT